MSGGVTSRVSDQWSDRLMTITLDQWVTSGVTVDDQCTTPIDLLNRGIPPFVDN